MKPAVKLRQPSGETEAGTLCNNRAVGGTMPEVNWTDTEEIAIRLLEAHPDVDPLTVRFTDLHRWVMELDGFAGDAKESNEKKLEAIQMAWYEEWQEEHG
jgi:FeS assembly protein IscX